MNYKVFFSPTFNTKRLVNLFCEKGKTYDLSQEFNNLSLNEDDILYLGVPCFGGRAPLYAIEKIKRIHGKNTKAIIMVSYGNRATEDTLIELYDILKANGFIVIAGIEAVSRHSIFREIAENRPDANDLAELANFKAQIEAKLKSDNCQEAKISGNRPYKERKPGGLIPLTNANCVSCGLCAKLCPNQAISHEDFKTIAEDRCIHCMRCIEVCEYNAKYISEDVLKGMLERLGPKFSGRKKNQLYI